MRQSLGLTLFHALCDVGNALEHLREQYDPLDAHWLYTTEVLGLLDAATDLLVRSEGLCADDDEEEMPCR